MIFGGQESSTERAYARVAQKSQHYAKLSLLVILASAVGTSLLYTTNSYHVKLGTVELVSKPTLLVGVGILFLISIGTQILVRMKHIDRRWYQARAVAETAKSLRWQYIMSVGDFVDSNFADQNLKQLLGSARNEFKDSIKQMDSRISAASEITPEMRRLASLQWQERRELYSSNRVKDQAKWYEQKAKTNRRLSKAFSYAAAGIQGVGIGLAVYAYLSIENYVSDPNTSANFVPPAALSLIATMVASVVGWAKARRYSELVEPYAYTSQVLTELDKAINNTTDERSFKNLALETERAISKEHQMWQLGSGLGVVKRLNR